MHILAYIDPGSGALIWQTIVGVFVGLFFYLRQTRRWLGRLVGRVLRTDQKAQANVRSLPTEKDKVEADRP